MNEVQWVVGKWYSRRDGLVVRCESTDDDCVFEGAHYPIRMVGSCTYTLAGEAFVNQQCPDDIVAGPFESVEDARNG